MKKLLGWVRRFGAALLLGGATLAPVFGATFYQQVQVCAATGVCDNLTVTVANPGPTSTAGIPYVQPTNMPTIGVGIVTSTTIPVSIATTIPVSIATTVPVSLATLPPLAAGSAVVGSFSVNQTTPGTTNLVNGKVCDQSTPTSCATVASNNGNFGAGNNSLFTIDFNYLWDPTGSAWTRRGGDTSTGVGWGTIGGSKTATIAAATSGPTVIKNAAGRLGNVVITTAGSTGTETFYDNASACSGTVLGTVQGTTAVAVNLIGTILKFDMPAANGITACGGTGSAAITASYY